MRRKSTTEYLLSCLSSGRVKARTAVVSLALCAMLLLSFVMTAFAWNDFTQHKTSVFRGTTDTVEVVLHKVEKDASGVIQANPVTPVVNAEFQLYSVGADGDMLISGGPWYTDASGKIVFDGRDSAHSKLPAGSYYFLETAPAYGYVYDKAADGSDITRYDFEITQADALSDAVVTVAAYNRRADGALHVTKTALGGAPAGEEFTFRVSFTNGRTDYKYRIKYADGSYSEAMSLSGDNGDSFVLKDGETAVFDAVPVGLGYMIRETASSDYFTTSRNSQGTVPDPGPDNTVAAVAEFTNTYLGAGARGSLTVSKTVSGTLADADDAFAFRVVFSDGGTYEYEKDGASYELESGGVLTLKGGESVVFGDLPIGLQYTVTELPNDLGYTASVSSMSGYIISDGVTAAFENNKDGNTEPGSLELRKTVTGTGRTDPFTFKVTFSEETEWSYAVYNIGAAETGENIILSGTGTGSELTLTLTRDQRAVFYPLPAGIGYTVEEQDIPANYVPSALAQEGTVPAGCRAYAAFNNHYETPAADKTRLIITKKLDGEVPEALKATVFRFTVEIEGQENSIPVELKGGESSDPISLPVGASYTVTELDVSKAGFVCVSAAYASGTAGTDAVTVEFTNRYVGPVCVTVNGVKEWKAPEGATLPASLPSSVVINLVNTANGVTVASAVASEATDYRFSFCVPKYDSEGREIIYTVVETEVRGFISEVTGDQYNGFTVTNTYDPAAADTVELTVRKLWLDEGNEDKRPETLQLQLYKNGVAEGEPFLLSEAAGWVTVLEGLDASASYSVKELAVPENYTSSVKRTENGFIIVNTYSSAGGPVDPGETVTVGGVKIWNDNGNAAGKRPSSVTLHVMNGDVTVKTVVVTAADGWTWSLAGLRKYDDNGGRIVYTLKEDAVPGYSTFIEGFTVTNTYNPGGSQGGDVVAPPTGDDFDLALWFSLMLLSIQALWIMVGRRLKRRGRTRRICR